MSREIKLLDMAHHACSYFLWVPLLILLLFHNTNAFAGQITLAWDASSGPDLAGYRLYYGQGSGNYTSAIDVSLQTTYTVVDLQDGAHYYFAVKAYDSSGNESGFSNEVSTTVGSSTIVANFSASPTSGIAPLLVIFTDMSTGSINSWLWDFGDGNTSTAINPMHTYTTKGIYTVKLTTSGSGSANTKTQACYIKVCRVGANGKKRCPRRHCS